MNWLNMTDDEIMDNLMQASTDIDHEKHVKDFSEHLKSIVTKENLHNQCKKYQAELRCFSKREFVGMFKKANDVRVFWKQWYTKSTDEYVAFIHLININGKIEVVNVSVS